MLGKKNPETTLLDAVFRLKSTPIKSRRSTGVTMDAEEIIVACLLNQEESGDSDDFSDSEEDDKDNEMLK